LVYNSEPGAVCYVNLPDIVSLLCQLNLPALTSLLDKQIAAKSDDTRALTPAQRLEQTSRTMDALFATELDEATLTLSAWQDGLPIEANPNLQPAAWLGVACIVTPPADTMTSPQHVREFAGPRR
jgi:hypothetical protein